ncbi:50S ribosomal protein L25/general stress protein Ctc [Tumidithrix elongata RA019]|uniref:Large ribosomal subunit protein bL25 n=1 Tax=Tumidithrix elongata BACA0141 TaxID=2716417 RepID=A0AAW9PQW2_9CYAN|nr:50S ribosomal protein L25/general stress protein Ctc [Tumidithrix elongata RA019]
MQLTIESQTRSPKDTPRALRRSGKIPGTVYGHKGSESTAISLDAKDVFTLLRTAVINNTLVELNIADGDFKGNTLLREVQHHPYKNEVYHLSFFSIAAQTSVEVEIPLHFVGVPVGVKVGGGSVDVTMKAVRVSCPPNSVPETIEVDITNLNVGEGIHISDLVFPEGVVPITDTTPLVVTILKK